MRIAVDDVALFETSGAFDCDGVYLGVLLPAMQALQEGGFDLTPTQRRLGLAGRVHLEVLNGGLEQLVYNAGALAFETPAALAELGWPGEADQLATALAIIRPPLLAGMLDRLTRLVSPRAAYARLLGRARASSMELGSIEKLIAELVEGQLFFAAVTAQARADAEGFGFSRPTPDPG